MCVSQCPQETFSPLLAVGRGEGEGRVKERLSPYCSSSLSQAGLESSNLSHLLQLGLCPAW